MKHSYFGTGGVRGHVGQFPMTTNFALKLGYAAGKVLAASCTKEVQIGKDTRRSGYMRESAMEAGLSAAVLNMRLPSGDADTILASDLVTNAVLEAEQTLAGSSRVLLRKSGTEPLIRVMVEGVDPHQTQVQAELIADAVRSASA